VSEYCAGEYVAPPSFDWNNAKTEIWMENKVHSPKYVEKECLESLLAYMWRFGDSQALTQVWVEIEVYH
jgi:hypothetical protein